MQAPGFNDVWQICIVAVATMLDRKFKKNMIIHITDGAPNSGLPLKDAVNYRQNKGIQIFTIGCGCTPSHGSS